jgi:hypothetical protein
VVADGGTGLRAGQALAWPEVGCDGDVFHGLQIVTRLATTLEKRAYAAIDQREQRLNVHQSMAPFIDSTLPLSPAFLFP